MLAKCNVTSEPEASEPEASEPEASEPEASEPEASEPDPSGSDVVGALTCRMIRIKSKEFARGVRPWTG